MSVDIPNKFFFKIGEVASLCGVEPYVLRYWESEFSVLHPKKNRAGQRVYRKEDIKVILEIKRLLYEERHTIAGAKRKLLKKSKTDGYQLDLFAQEAIKKTISEVKKGLGEILELLR